MVVERNNYLLLVNQELVHALVSDTTLSSISRELLGDLECNTRDFETNF